MPKTYAQTELTFPLGEQDSQFWEQVQQLDALGEQLDGTAQGLQVTVRVNGRELYIPYVRFQPLIPETKS